MNPMLRFEFLGSLNPLPGTRNLNQDPILADAQFLVEVNNVLSLGNGGLGVKGEAGVDFSGDAAGYDLQNFLPEFDEETVQGGIDLVVDVAALF